MTEQQVASTSEGTEIASAAIDIRPAVRPLLVGVLLVAAVSALTLPAPLALASTVLGALMIAGADVDARTCLLPDMVTLGALGCGVLAQALLDPFDPLQAATQAALRAALTAAAIALVRWSYGRLRQREGIGLGDVKLAAAIGAWLPLELIPLCFVLATGAALIITGFARWRGTAIGRETRIAFGAFLCPALWLTFYAGALMEYAA